MGSAWLRMGMYARFWIRESVMRVKNLAADMVFPGGGTGTGMTGGRLWQYEGRGHLDGCRDTWGLWHSHGHCVG